VTLLDQPHTGEMVPFAAPSRALATLDDRVMDFVVASKAPATARAYRSDWVPFTAWCADHDLKALPAMPATIARYLTDLAGVKALATLQRRITLISHAHKTGGHESPTRSALVRDRWKGIPACSASGPSWPRSTRRR
jgi:hypothetical protein